MKKQTTLLTVCILLFMAARSQPCTLPTDLFPSDTIIQCTGTSYTLNAPVVAGATYTWSIVGETGPSVTLGNDLTVWLQMNDATCMVSDTVVVLLNSFLRSPVVSDLKLCKGQPARPLPVVGQHLLWYDEAIGGVGNPVIPVPSTLDTGRMTVWFSQTIRGCESPRLPMRIKVIDKPMFELGEAFIIPCGAPGVQLQVVDDGESEYTWSNGSNEVEITAPERGLYSLYAINMCGDHSDTTRAVECEDRCVQFPNAFSPNSDGRNDKYQAACFCPVPTYKLAIYNRNGEQVFQTSDPTAGWDGYFKGKMQPNGVYVYYAEFFDFVLKNNFSSKGSLVLLH